MRKITLGFLFLIANSSLVSEDINLKYGQLNLNQYSGVFATMLRGDYTIVVKTDWNTSSISATVVNNETKDAWCLPENSCNINRN